jgi:hypothetical protein
MLDKVPYLSQVVRHLGLGSQVLQKQVEFTFQPPKTENYLVVLHLADSNEYGT